MDCIGLSIRQLSCMEKSKMGSIRSTSVTEQVKGTAVVCTQDGPDESISVPCESCRYCSEACLTELDLPKLLETYDRLKSDGWSPKWRIEIRSRK